MKRERMVNSYILTHDDRRIKDKKHEEYAAEKTLNELGIEYAKKYAKKSIKWLYVDRRDGTTKSFTEEQDLRENRWLKLCAKEIVFTIEES